MSKGGRHRVTSAALEVRIRAIALYGMLLVVLFMGKLLAANFTKDDLRAIIERVQPKLRAEATEMDLMYWPGLLTKFPELQHLTSNADAFKTAAIDLLVETSKAPSGTSEPIPLTKTSGLLIAAMYGLKPHEYLDFVEQVLARAEGEKLFLNDADFAALVLPKHDLTDIFVSNHQHPRVRNILERLKRLWLASKSRPPTSGEPSVAGTIDEILSGQTAQWRERQKERYPGEYPNNLKAPIIAAVAAAPNEGGVSTTAPTAIPVPSTPSLTAPPAASPSPTTPLAQTPAATAEQKAPAWPWLVGIAALTVIALLVWKRRA